MYHMIFTEAKNELGIRTILGQHFPDGYTIHATCMGYWKGQSEASLVIGVACADAERVNQAATDIKQMNSQESVMVVSLPAEVSFL